MIRSRTGRCVVFDLDDTLYEEIEFVRSGFQAVSDAVRQRYAVDAAATLAARLEQRQLDGAFQEIIDRHHLPGDALPVMMDVYRNHRPSLSVRAGVRAAVEALKERDGVVGCITDGRSSTQRNKVAALGLTTLLDPLLISEETGYAKPEAHNFLAMMRLVDADEFWYVGDNLAKDFVAPNALGWVSLGIETGGGIHPVVIPAESHRPKHHVGLAEGLALLLMG